MAHLICRLSEKLDIGWLQFDFWANFTEQENHTRVLQLTDALIAMLKRGAFVMIHCAAGIHRTGLMAFVILRRLGMPYKEAREFLRVLRPVTREQVGDDRIKIAEVKFQKLFQIPEATIGNFHVTPLAGRSSLSGLGHVQTRLPMSQPPLVERTARTTSSPIGGMSIVLPNGDASRPIRRVHSDVV
eukprot:7142887-Pyramimonas_sp.AAC.2